MSHEQFATWDAAYVLGSLSPADRAAYEEHLASCPACREAIAELAPITGLLSRIEPDDTGAAGDADARERLIARASALPAAPHVVPRRRRRRTWAAIGAAVVAAAMAVAIPFLVGTEDPPREIALERVVDAPLDASVALTPAAWGTRVDMTCHYGEDASAPAGGRDYALVVVSDDGVESELSTWRAYAGSTATLSAGTALDVDEIGAFEIRAIPDGPVLLRSDTPAG